MSNKDAQKDSISVLMEEQRERFGIDTARKKLAANDVAKKIALRAAMPPDADRAPDGTGAVSPAELATDSDWSLRTAAMYMELPLQVTMEGGSLEIRRIAKKQRVAI